METIMEFWPWYIAGPLIAIVMFLLTWFEKTFGVSSTMRVVCSALGAGKRYEFFAFDWKSQIWNLVFVVGAMLGGWIAVTFLNGDAAVEIAAATQKDLEHLGFDTSSSLLPQELFSWNSLKDAGTLLILIAGGLLIGFGTRWAGGCTSGHAITGLSNLQLPSLIAVIGFFIGGLLVTHLLFPILF
ncbi:YeeE/YedE family protein [Luteibaculum oceani]|uniref:YeeE/YedE family protein n=1 Tax=Luteibaculum oceani TaxID=1294296 RepID=A0A5C6UVK7_9FLAO|nr:YeeE/YedE thiosulfate transporter family protein [Luteibaculum oceani]TXC76251.1 YeeE/YedE family protein [Luteibaculum oceani]